MIGASVVHAIGTLAVAAVALRTSTEVEHMPPDVAARLREEGVAYPDRALSDLIAQYADDAGRRRRLDGAQPRRRGRAHGSCAGCA